MGLNLSKNAFWQQDYITHCASGMKWDTLILVCIKTIRDQLQYKLNVCTLFFSSFLSAILICSLQISRSFQSVLLRQRQVSSKIHFHLICLSEQSHFIVRMLGRYVAWVECDSGAKESVISVLTSTLEWTDSGPAAGLLKGQEKRQFICRFAL